MSDTTLNPEETADSPVTGLARRRVVQTAAWMTPGILLAAAAPATAASVPPNNARVVEVWTPTQANGAAGYLSTTDGHANFRGDGGLTWNPYVDFRNDGPDPLPAGTVLSFTYDNTSFDPATVVSNTVPGGVSAPFTTTNGNSTTIHVTTLAPIPANTPFRVNYQTVSRATAPIGVQTFSGEIAPAAAFNDSNPADNTKNSGHFGIARNTDAAVTFVSAPSGSVQDGGTLVEPFINFKNNGPVALPPGTSLDLQYDVRYFNPPTVKNNSANMPGGVSAATIIPPTAGSNIATLRVFTKGSIPVGTDFTMTYSATTKAIATTSSTQFNGAIQAPLDTNSANDIKTGAAFTVLSPETDAAVTYVWSPSSGSVQDNGTKLAPYVNFKNNGPAPLPAGTILNFAWHHLGFNDATITSNNVPGGITAPRTYQGTGGMTAWKYIEVKTLAPIAAGREFSITYAIETENLNTDTSVRFLGEIIKTGRGNDTNSANNLLNSPAFTVRANQPPSF